MKKTLLILPFILFLLACQNNKDKSPMLGEVQPVHDTSLAQNDKAMNRSQAFFEVTDSNEGGYAYNSVEVTFENVYMRLRKNADFAQYVAKYTTHTQAHSGAEGQDRTIKVEVYGFGDLNSPLLEFEQKCDKLTMANQRFETITYGCCAAENLVEVFDFEKRSIIKADNMVYGAEVPNSDLYFFVGYKAGTSSSGVVGELILSYASNDKYVVAIKSSKNMEDDCPPFSPEIKIKSEDKSDTYNERTGEYTLWSLDKLKNKSGVNGLVIKLDFDCADSYGNDEIEIPLINGVPFGNDIRRQEVFLDK